MKQALGSLFALLAIFVLAAAPALGQATRTWVSGVGDDANPCSRTAPCKTFAGAISKTAAGGEINVLDPGGFGAVTITKSITISSEGFEAGILASGTNGVVINAGASDFVVLRGLDFEGANTGLNGIRFLAGGSLHVESCTFNRFAQKGISFEPSGMSQLTIKDTVIRNNLNSVNGGGILIQPVGAALARVALDRVRVENNLFGIRAQDNASVTIRDSEFSGNINNGVLALSTGGSAQINVDDSMVSNSFGGTGIRANGVGALIRISNVTVTNNSNGLAVQSSGQIISFGNNRIAGNTASDGAPTSTIGEQ